MTTIEAVPTLPACAHQPKPYAGPSKADVLAMRAQYMHPAVFTIYKDPVMIVEGYMQYLWDETGRRYLDCLAGIDRKSTRLNSSHIPLSRMPSSA